MRLLEPDYTQAQRLVLKTFYLEDDFRSAFTLPEREYIKTYIDLAQEHIDNQTLYDQLRKPWSQYNFRYGHWSVLGTLCEFASIPIILHSNYITARLSPDTKELQMKGHDLIITNPTWRDPYSAQVKHLVRNEKGVIIRSSYFNHKYTTDRLLLVDPFKMEALHVSYNDARLWFLTHKKEAKDGKLLVLMDDFRQLNNYHAYRV